MDAEQPRQSKRSNPFVTILPLVVILGLLMWLYIRPQPFVVTGLEGTTVESLALEPFYMPAADQDVAAGQESGKTSANLQGKVTLLSFWATWCAPCRRELPHLGAIASRFAGDPDVQIWTVLVEGDVNDQTQETVAGLFAEAEVSLPVYIPTGPLMPDSLMPEGIPAALLIGPDGKVAGAWIGYNPDLETEVIRLVTELQKAR